MPLDPAFKPGLAGHFSGHTIFLKNFYHVINKMGAW
jgi:hypothetical protein